MLRRRLMMLAQNMYRWIRVRSIIVMGRKTDGEAAPGVDAESRNAMVMGRTMDGNGHPAEDITVDREMQMGRRLTGQTADAVPAIVARAMRMSRGTLAAYGVKLITSIRQYVLGRKARGEAAPGAVGVSRKAVLYTETMDGERAGAEITEVKRAMRTGYIADGNAYDGLPVELLRAMGMGRGVAPERAPAEDGAIQRALMMGSGIEVETRPAAEGIAQRAMVMGTCGKVAAATWVGPTLLSDRWLLIRQARSAVLYDAVVGGNGLEVR